MIEFLNIKNIVARILNDKERLVCVCFGGSDGGWFVSGAKVMCEEMFIQKIYQS